MSHQQTGNRLDQYFMAFTRKQ